MSEGCGSENMLYRVDQRYLLHETHEAMACVDFPSEVDFHFSTDRRRRVINNGSPMETMIVTNQDPELDDTLSLRIYGLPNAPKAPEWKLSYAKKPGVVCTSPRRQQLINNARRHIRVAPRVKPGSPFVDSLYLLRTLGVDHDQVDIIGCRSEIPFGDDTELNNRARLYDNSWRLFLRLSSPSHIGAKLVSHLVFIPRYWKERDPDELDSKVARGTVVIRRSVNGVDRYFEFSRGIHGTVDFLFADENFSVFLPEAQN